MTHENQRTPVPIQLSARAAEQIRFNTEMLEGVGAAAIEAAHGEHRTHIEVVDGQPEPGPDFIAVVPGHIKVTDASQSSET